MTTDQYADAFVKAFLHAFVQLWFMWVFLALLAAAYVVVGICKRLARTAPTPRSTFRRSDARQSSFRVAPQTNWRCATCGSFVSSRVRDYCLARPESFSGQVFCFPHQRSSRRQR